MKRNEQVNVALSKEEYRALKKMARKMKKKKLGTTAREMILSLLK